MFLYAIDGTGASDDADYRKDMDNSFCHRICKLTSGSYWRGPTLSGNNTFDIADNLFTFIMREKAKNTDKKIYLVGHSRGGAAVIYIAQQLHYINIIVDGMFLFDAVDKTLSRKNVQAIPPNVKNCFHARRDRSLANYCEKELKKATNDYENCRKAHGSCGDLKYRLDMIENADLQIKRASRSVNMFGPGVRSMDFGNCGVQVDAPCTLAEPGCLYSEKKFYGSHGAIGGAPLQRTDGAPELLINIDKRAMDSVWMWMDGNMKRVGVYGNV